MVAFSNTILLTIGHKARIFPPSNPSLELKKPPLLEHHLDEVLKPCEKHRLKFRCLSAKQLTTGGVLLINMKIFNFKNTFSNIQKKTLHQTFWISMDLKGIQKHHLCRRLRFIKCTRSVTIQLFDDLTHLKDLFQKCIAGGECLVTT